MSFCGFGTSESSQDSAPHSSSYFRHPPGPALWAGGLSFALNARICKQLGKHSPTIE